MKGIKLTPEKAIQRHEEILERRQQIYQERKEAGICTVCGKVPARPGKTHCERCAARSARIQKNYYERMKSRG